MAIDLASRPDGEFHKLRRVAIKCLIVPKKYFEKALPQAINKLGTDERALTRVVATQAEVNTERIKEESKGKNRVTLEKAIVGDTSGDCEKMLLALIEARDI
ncbi:hypothetical protein GOBAR_DD02492 [Gossypium barbadense]|nr:hypothetical protein GOBAR_DD02492 [Gossypium barbadense]